MQGSLRIFPLSLEPPRWLFPCLFPDWRKARNTPSDIVMFHLPTSTAFAIVYDPDRAMIGGLTIFGFAARIYLASDTTPETAAELEAIAQALARIERGQYGICADCGQPIEAARLALLPQAIRCGSCAGERRA